MKTRHSVFETNSSSTHSLVIDTFTPMLPQPFSDSETASGVVEVRSGKFGWDVAHFENVHDKLSYVFTHAMRNTDANIDPDEIKDNAKLDLIREAVKQHAGLDVRFIKEEDGEYFQFGYIDHQSSGVPRPAFESLDSMMRFLFSPASYFETDNDNR